MKCNLIYFRNIYQIGTKRKKTSNKDNPQRGKQQNTIMKRRKIYQSALYDTFSIWRTRIIFTGLLSTQRIHIYKKKTNKQKTPIDLFRSINAIKWITVILNNISHTIFYNGPNKPFASKKFQTFINTTMKHILKKTSK